MSNNILSYKVKIYILFLIPSHFKFQKHKHSKTFSFQPFYFVKENRNIFTYRSLLDQNRLNQKDKRIMIERV